MLKQDITSRLLINSFHLKNSCLRPAGKRLHLLLCLLRAVRVSVEACTRACAAGGWRTSSTSPTPGERARLSQVSHQTISPISCLWQHFSAEDRLVCRYSRSALDCKTPQNEEQRRSPQTLVSTADICLVFFQEHAVIIPALYASGMFCWKKKTCCSHCSRKPDGKVFRCRVLKDWGRFV